MARNQQKKSKKSTKKKSGKSSASGVKTSIKSIVAVTRDDRFRRVSGMFLTGSAVFILLSCVSYIFTGHHDLRLVLEGGAIDGSPEVYRNIMGKAGAHTAWFFMNQQFGIAALLIPLILLLVGIRVWFRKTLLPFGKTLRLSFVGILFVPLVFGFFGHQSVQGMEETLAINVNENLVGAYGLRVTEWGVFTLGNFGTFLLILFVAAAVVVVSFAGPMQWLQTQLAGLFGKLGQASEKKEETEEEVATVSNSFKSDDKEETLKETDPDEDILSEIIGDEEPEAEVLEVETTSFSLDESQSIEDEGTEAQEAKEPVAEELEVSTPEPKRFAETEGESGLSIEIEETKEEEELSEEELDSMAQQFGEYDPKLDLSRFELPSIELLEQRGDGTLSINKDELEANKNKIVETLNNYKIEISKIKATIGPTVTLYEIIPAPGVRISKIKNLEDDIALSLAALGIRIIAPIPGKGTIGIEVPNSKPSVVSMRSLIASDKFQKSDMALPVALGKTIANETLVADLAKMPHLLMAGATGQGKSVGLNAILVSLMYKLHPAQLKFVLVDPKKVELTLYNKIERHYLAKLPDEEEAIITDTSKVVKTLNSLCVEMDERYELLKKAMCRNLKEYNTKFVARKLNPENGHRYLPYIVLVVDEFADLIMTAGKEVETPIARLAQLARAIGIHLIIATQRPSVNIITGIIKANFPARIAFRVTSKVDSRTILDAGGADQLIGRGDMLFSTGSDLIRLQCGFVDTPEVEEICDFVGSQQGYPSAFLLPEFVDDSGGEIGNIADEERDVLFEDAARVVVMHQQGSASLLQRKLKLGYNRAGRLVDQLEAAGIIGPFKGSKAREVLIPDEMSLEQLLNREVEI